MKQVGGKKEKEKEKKKFHRPNEPEQFYDNYSRMQMRQMSSNHEYFLFEDRIKKEILVYKLEKTAVLLNKPRSKTTALPTHSKFTQPLDGVWGSISAKA